MEEPTGPAAMVKSLFPSVLWCKVDSRGGGRALNTAGTKANMASVPLAPSPLCGEKGKI